jgi:hypothetical protein
MSLPGFTETGDLPPGVYQASLAETVEHFSADLDRRKLLALRLERIYHMALETRHLARFVIFGSFVTDKTRARRCRFIYDYG